MNASGLVGLLLLILLLSVLITPAVINIIRYLIFLNETIIKSETFGASGTLLLLLTITRSVTGQSCSCLVYLCGLHGHPQFS